MASVFAVVSGLVAGGLAAAVFAGFLVSAAEEESKDAVLQFGNARDGLAVVALLIGVVAATVTFAVVHRLARRGELDEPDPAGGVGEQDAQVRS